MWRSRLLLLLLVVSSVVLSQPGDASLKIGTLYIPKPTHLEILVEPPEGINFKVEEFHLVEDDEITIRATSLQNFRDSKWPVAVVLAVDASKSMSRVFEDLRKPLESFAGGFKDQLSLVTFADTVTDDSFKKSREDIAKQLTTLRLSGNSTHLYEGLHRSLDLLKERAAPERQRILVISDGADESPDDPGKIDDIINSAKTLRVAIDTIWVHRPDQKTKDTRDSLTRLSSETDGYHRDVQNSSDLNAGLAEVQNRIDRAVIVSFDREVQESSQTKGLGITLGRPDVGSASIRLASAIAKSQTPGPSTGTDSQNVSGLWGLMKDIRAWLALAVIAYIVYALAYVAVRKSNAEKAKNFPFRPWPVPPLNDADSDQVSAPEPAPVHKRNATIVQQRGGSSSGQLWLEGVEGPLKAERIPVGNKDFQIGADENSDLAIAHDNYLSANHATLKLSDAGWVLLDRGSKNGTFLDGRKLGKGERLLLQAGQVIRVGASEFRVMFGANPGGNIGGIKETPPKPGDSGPPR